MTTAFRSYPKPERISKGKRKAERVRQLTRAQCRAAVIRREHSRCQRCGRTVTDDCWPWEPQRAHVHEIVPRSLGGDPHDPNGCQLLCAACHLPNGVHRAGDRTV
jgi:5-methylcytosine-specific restriction endonuclease McrA